MLAGEEAKERAANDRRAVGMAGVAVMGSVVTGFLGFLLSVILVLTGAPDAAALALLAGAVAFGLVANALLRS